MLEDELRETFAAAVRTPPSLSGPADRAIRKGRRMTRRRRTMTALMAATVFVAGLSGAGSWWGTNGGGTDQDAISYQNLFGVVLGGAEQPVTVAPEQLASIKMPVDVRVGDQVFTTDGNQLTLTAGGRIDRVLKVPVGWVYSDDRHVVRLATAGQPATELVSEQSSWQVNAEGTSFASTSSGTLQLRQLPPPEHAVVAPVSTTVPAETTLVGFAGEQVVVGRSDRLAFDSWSATGATPYTETWNKDLVAVYSNGTKPLVGLVRGLKGTSCLVEVTVEVPGLQLGRQLGCDTMLASAASRIAVSPDGQWLAIGTPSGVHLIDLAQARVRAGSPGDVGSAEVAIAASCAAARDSPTIWADRKTVLIVTDKAGVVACRTDGSRFVVPLPAGVTSDWELIPAVADLIND